MPVAIVQNQNQWMESTSKRLVEEFDRNGVKYNTNWIPTITALIYNTKYLGAIYDPKTASIVENAMTYLT